MAQVLVRGAGDIGSAVAHRLRSEGHAVVLHDQPSPAHARRGMAFTDAFFEGTCMLAGMLAKRASDVASLRRMLSCGHALPVVDADFADVLATLGPDVLVDAQVHKHEEPEPLRGLAVRTIGLGPGFVAGRNADLVVETAWGEELGKVIRKGPARDYGGEPRRLGGHGRERYVYAPVGGILRTARAIGDAVRKGEEVACISGTVVIAPLSGVLRGLSHDGACVSPGTKVIEVDPRGVPAGAFGLGERPARIANGVASAVAECQEAS
jgi:xanthine dehydrogenase accessory factor